MATIVAVSNQKGGVGKTTTSGAMAAALSARGFRVLAIDMDPQGNLSDSAGLRTKTDIATVYHLLKEEEKAEDVVQHTEAFDILPSNSMLASLEQELTQVGREQRLRKTAGPLVDQYDYIIIDTPPSLGILTINALTFADEVIIPTTPGIFSTKGINDLYGTIENVREYCGSHVRVRGILLTRFNPRNTISQDMKELTQRISQTMGAQVFDTFIRASVIVDEAQANAVDIFRYKRTATVSQDYEAFIEEYLKGGKAHVNPQA